MRVCAPGLRTKDQTSVKGSTGARRAAATASASEALAGTSVSRICACTRMCTVSNHWLCSRPMSCRSSTWMSAMASRTPWARMSWSCTRSRW